MNYVRNYLMLPVVLAAAASLAFLPGKTAATGAIPHRIHRIQTHDHTASAPNVIDGQLHPELIQDKHAYRLFFLTAATAPAATIEDVNRQRDFLRPIQLSESQLLSVRIILADFKAQYLSAIAHPYASALAALANHTTPDIASFLTQRDNLVLSTKAAIENALGAETWARFNTHVQKEKSKMKVAAEGGAQ